MNTEIKKTPIVLGRVEPYDVQADNARAEGHEVPSADPRTRAPRREEDLDGDGRPGYARAARPARPGGAPPPWDGTGLDPDATGDDGTPFLPPALTEEQIREEEAAKPREPAILEAVSAVKDLAHRLTDPAAVVDLEALDPHRVLFAARATVKRRADALDRLNTLAAAIMGETDESKIPGHLAQAASLAASLTAGDPFAAVRFNMLAAAENLAPKAWICRALQWIAGRPAMGIGYPGAGKTYALLSAAVALSVGRPVWGCSWITGPIDALTGRARPLRCLFVDLDAGKVDVENKLARIRRGMGITNEEHERARLEIALRRGVPLAAVPHPFEGLALSDLPDPGALLLASYAIGDLLAFREAWTELARGFDLVLVDSMRDLAPFADENDSRIGSVPREIGAASRASGAAFVLLHHAGRAAPAKPGQAVKVPQYAARGSSAIDGKAGAQLVFERDADGRRKLTMTRDTDPDDEEGLLAPIWISLRRGPGEAEVTARLVDSDDDGRQAEDASASTAQPPKVDNSRGSADVDLAREVLRAHQGINGKAALVNEICDAAKRRTKRRGGPIGTGRAEAAVRVLRDKGEIEDRKTSDKPPRPRWFWLDPDQPKPGDKAREDAALRGAMSGTEPDWEAIADEK